MEVDQIRCEISGTFNTEETNSVTSVKLHVCAEWENLFSVSTGWENLLTVGIYCREWTQHTKRSIFMSLCRLQSPGSQGALRCSLCVLDHVTMCVSGHVMKCFVLVHQSVVWTLLVCVCGHSSTPLGNYFSSASQSSPKNYLFHCRDLQIWTCPCPCSASVSAVLPPLWTQVREGGTESGGGLWLVYSRL